MTNKQQPQNSKMTFIETHDLQHDLGQTLNASKFDDK